MLNDEDVGDETKKLMKAYREIFDDGVADDDGTFFLYTCPLSNLDMFFHP
jgi:hypothetical protein